MRDFNPDLRHAFAAVRRHTVALAAPLSEEDCCVQSMPDASPVKWHLAHTTWFFETFILERFEPAFQPFHPMFRVLFNSYYNGVGDKYPRPQRGMLTRPALEEVKAYRENVDRRMAALLDGAHGDRAELARLLELGLEHEKQHQELVLTDLKHLLSLNPLQPVYRTGPEETGKAGPLSWLGFDGGIAGIGHSGKGFCFDNETPRHRQFLEPYQLASRLVTNGEYAAFIEAGGYRDPGLWLSEGWDWVQTQRIAHPLYWRATEAGWEEFTLHGSRPLRLDDPVTHVSYFEADAYARWSDARLPSEFEWEHAAAGTEQGVPPHGLQPTADGRTGLGQLYGAGWQWTASSYAPYPGYRPALGAIGEYNGKFMVNQYVLRGSSCATPAHHSRATYRNFFPAPARWQFTAIRLARSS
ncbi:ergothioneine biosynthesis protein EgtB [Noviherbaspirillum humi]|uniref:Ergothioneine biosynthesis protein EgtB n=1 Tax=Noviherbaspirillum humi TaxID=1688639 RepID=A0A239DE93_9BURK|nr:ergothioneine biosynthesis protein EgtB [Noviherbaspirillum humi]SNS30679.1 ergothioneine biosynthesis protein EgtB [Noviherbaspirillum humi]